VFLLLVASFNLPVTLLYYRSSELHNYSNKLSENN